jgi:hypothetical protein
MFSRANCIAHFRAFSRGDESLAASSHFVNCHWIFAQVLLQADEDDGHAMTPIARFFGPFGIDVFK